MACHFSSSFLMILGLNETIIKKKKEKVGKTLNVEISK